MLLAKSGRCRRDIAAASGTGAVTRIVPVSSLDPARAISAASSRTRRERRARSARSPAFLGDLQLARIALEQGPPSCRYSRGDLLTGRGGREVHRAEAAAEKLPQSATRTNSARSSRLRTISSRTPWCSPITHLSEHTGKAQGAARQLRLPVFDVPQGEGGLVCGKITHASRHLYLLALCLRCRLHRVRHHRPRLGDGR